MRLTRRLDHSTYGSIITIIIIIIQKRERARGKGQIRDGLPPVKPALRFPFAHQHLPPSIHHYGYQNITPHVNHHFESVH